MQRQIEIDKIERRAAVAAARWITALHSKEREESPSPKRKDRCFRDRPIHDAEKEAAFRAAARAPTAVAVHRMG